MDFRKRRAASGHAAYGAERVRRQVYGGAQFRTAHGCVRARTRKRSAAQRFELRAMFPSRHILGIRVNAPAYREAVSSVIRWARCAESRYVCLGTVNNLIHARDSAQYREVLERADLLTPDGMP